MINNGAALQINDALLNNMGVFGSTIRTESPASMTAAQEKVKKEYQLSTKLLYGMTDYLNRVDTSLKKQTNATRSNYNKQLVAIRETAIEEKKQPDAVPVAANDNDISKNQEQEGSFLGMLATGLVVGGAALLISKFDVISKAIGGILGTVGSALSSVGSVLGLDPTPEPIEPRPEPTERAQPETNIPRDKEYRSPPPRPAQQPNQKKTPPQSRPSNQAQPTPSMPSSSSSSGSNRQSTTPATPVSKPPMTTSPSRVGSNPPAATPDQGSPAGKPTMAPGEIPKNDIVALGNYLASKGADKSKMEHPALSGRVGKHSPNSRHYRGMAIDVNFSGPNEGAILDALEPQLRAAGYNTIWRKPGHETHMHVSVGGAEGSKGGKGLAAGMIAAAGEVVDNTLETLAKKFERLKPTNVMTKLISEEALARQNDLLNAKITPGQMQGAVSTAPQNIAPPSPIQSSVRKTSESVVSQYLFMFLDQKVEMSNPKAIVQA